jgi:hypothetical protein
MARGKGFAAMSASPRQALTITAGIDMAEDRFEGTTVPWGRWRATAMKASGKRLKQTRSTLKATAAQVERWDRMRTIGCIACLLNEIDHDLARVPRCSMVPHSGNQEIHHLTSGGRRLGHDATICLCRYHHEGDHLPRYDVGYKATVPVFGPSFGQGRKPFAAFYGADTQLLEYQNLVLLSVRPGEPSQLDELLRALTSGFSKATGLSHAELTAVIPDGDRGETDSYLLAMYRHYHGETP